MQTLGGTSLTSLHAESSCPGQRAHRVPRAMTRTAASRAAHCCWLSVRHSHSLGPTRCCPSGFGILSSWGCPKAGSPSSATLRPRAIKVLPQWLRHLCPEATASACYTAGPKGPTIPITYSACLLTCGPSCLLKLIVSYVLASHHDLVT